MKKKYTEYTKDNPESLLLDPLLKHRSIVVKKEPGTESIGYYIWNGKTFEKIKVKREPLFFPLDIDYVRERIPEIKSELADLTAKKSKVEKKEINPWEFLDFLCFSLVTQTTVSFGDIVPNNRLVRIVVSLQLLVSMFLLVIVINNYILRKNN